MFLKKVNICLKVLYLLNAVWSPVVDKNPSWLLWCRKQFNKMIHFQQTYRSTCIQFRLVRKILVQFISNVLKVSLCWDKYMVNVWVFLHNLQQFKGIVFILRVDLQGRKSKSEWDFFSLFEVFLKRCGVDFEWLLIFGIPHRRALTTCTKILQLLCTVRLILLKMITTTMKTPKFTNLGIHLSDDSTTIFLQVEAYGINWRFWII